MHGGRVESCGDDVIGGLVVLDVALENRIEDVVRRQRILIGLVGPKLRRRRFRQRALVE